MRVITAADRRGLAQLADAEARYRAARAIVESQGMTFSVQTESGTVVRERPEVGIMERAGREVRAWQIEMGTTPASRTRVHAQQPEPTDEPKKQRFFAGRHS